MVSVSRIYGRLTARMDPPVFFGAAALVVLFLVYGALWTGQAASLFESVQQWIVEVFGWYYVLATTGFLLFSVFLVFSRYARFRLGGQNAKPEFSRATWLIMLFSAGMGTGLVFWGVAEPMFHFLSPPMGEGETPEAARTAMRFAYFHWGLHAWSIYIVIGISLAYFHFRHKLPLAPRSLFYPLIGNRIHGPIGKCVDILCTIGTLLGVGTSLGLGAMQINTGLAQFAPIGMSQTAQVAIIAVITAVATVSVVLGVKDGIRRLSQFNIVLAALMFAFVLFAGPTVYLIELFITSTGAYLQTLVQTSLWIDLDRESGWQSQWTLYYWGWWISWSPFVGIFTARISKGRTIREFILGVLLVPTIVTFAWLAVFGGTAIGLHTAGNGAVAEQINQDVALSLHTVLQQLPFADISLTIATLLVVIFFITSSDSGSLVDDMVTSGGHPHPPKAQRVFWAVSEGAIAATLLLVGGLRAMQNAAIASGLPMSFLLIAACVSLYIGLRRDYATGLRSTGKADIAGD